MQPRVLNGRYELLAPIGRGGMATVYRGRDLRLARPVAIKLLHNYYAADDEFLQRFTHEALSAASLSAHPNIVDVYDVGQDGDANYIVIEYIDGQDLKAVIDAEAPLPPERALTIAAQVAEGLDYAHRYGLVHRDVKPQNVLIAPDGQVRITDFGIAKSERSTAITQAGTTFGTADYISPEQAQGLTSTPQSDIYSLGVVLFEMLTGALPFRGDTPMAVALQHIQQPPPSLRQFNPAIPPLLDTLVLRAMAKDPAQRPTSAKAFAQEMRDYLAGRLQPTMVVPPVTPQRQPQRQPAARPAYDAAPAEPPRRQPRQPATRAYAPPLAVAPPRDRSGFGFGTLLIGLLLLAGILTLTYLALNTDFGDLFDFGGGAVAPAPSPSLIAAPSPSGAPVNTPVPPVELPELVGRSEADVAGPGGLLEQLGLQRYVDPNDATLAPRYNEAPAGTIILQDPAPFTPVPPGSPIRIVVSLGLLPDVVGQPFEQAQTLLQNNGLIVQRQDAPSRDVPAGQVAAQSIPAGSAPARGTAITLTVSRGDVVEFPNVLSNGTLRDDAIARIEAAGLNVVQVDEQGPDRLPNFDQFQPNEAISATANGQPIDPNGAFVPRGADVILGVRAP
jgi:eukaryotic-like serine/threonine-protein kinase